MPYKDPDKQREYMRQWMAKRRKDWFDENGPCVDCGSWEELELDHVDPASEVDHKVWSWSKERRDIETAKCVVRCHNCHVGKTKNNKEHAVGEASGNAKYTTESISEIRQMFNGSNKLEIMHKFDITRRHLNKILRRDLWQHI